MLLVSLAVLLACAQEGHEPTAPVRPTEARSAMRQSTSGAFLLESTMEQVHRRVVRALAMALANSDVRSSVYSAIRASPYREGKLHLRSLLSANGSSLLAAARNYEPGLQAALDSLVDVEFYMPVRAHRRAWTGGSNLIVAGVLRDDGRIPMAFDLAGNEVVIHSAQQPPDTPTLAVVPVETNFTPLPSSATDASAAVVDPPGTYLTSASLDDDYEAG